MLEYLPMKPLPQSNICTAMVTATSFMIAKVEKQLKCPSRNELVKKYGTYIQQRISQPRKKEVLLSSVATWTDLEGIMLRERSPPPTNAEKDQAAWSHPYVESKKRMSMSLKQTVDEVPRRVGEWGRGLVRGYKLSAVRGIRLRS